MELVYFFAALLLITVFGIGSQRLGLWSDRRLFPPIGSLYDIGTHRLHLVDSDPSASLRVTVVADSVQGGSCLDWTLVATEAAGFCRFISFDRSGYGWSDPGPAPRNSEKATEELRLLLKAAAINPPYILVGHSLGGANARLFAQRYPREVVGLVLVDSYQGYEVSEANQAAFRREVSSLIGRLSAYRLNITLGIARALVALNRFPRETRRLVLKVPAQFRRSYVAHIISSKAIQAMIDETSNLEASIRSLKELPSLKSLPLVVIRRGAPGPNDTAPVAGSTKKTARGKDPQNYKDAQLQLSGLSSRGKLLAVTRVLQHIPLESPDIVVRVLREMVEEIEAKQP